MECERVKFQNVSTFFSPGRVNGGSTSPVSSVRSVAQGHSTKAKNKVERSVGNGYNDKDETKTDTSEGCAGFAHE